MIHPWLVFDVEREAQSIADTIRATLVGLKRRGCVVGVSGGIDSSATLALCVKAVGAQRVVALQMPERHSADETLELSARLCETFGVRAIHEDISAVLEAVGFYRRYDEAVRSVVPHYATGWKSKIVLHGSQGQFSVFHIVARGPQGEAVDIRLPLNAYLEIVASTNFKQRIRKMLEYYYADRYNYAVSGTPNRLEYDQGFFVKLGDGAADFKPIAHLYKTQVYHLARYLGVPESILQRAPTTDTYSLPQGQDEFYFALPYDTMDLCLFGKNTGLSPREVAGETGLSVEQVETVYRDIETKRVTTRYLHHAPVLMSPVPEIQGHQ